jgi:hypothetical protein
MVEMDNKMKIIENIFDDYIKFEQKKKERFFNTLAGKLTKENLIRAMYELSSESYSKEKFLELCINYDILEKELLTDLFIHVHTMGHLYSYFLDCNISFEKQLNFFQKCNIPFTCFEAKIDNLPETFEVFRGLYAKPINIEECGFCWTLDEETAKKFALCPPNNKGFIIKGTVKRDDIFGYVTSRDEEEIIVNPQKVKNKQMYEIWKK